MITPTIVRIVFAICLAATIYTTPLAAQLTITHPNGGELFVAGSSINIDWQGVAPNAQVKLDFSTNNGANWENITGSVSGLRYNWVVPNAPSAECIMRITQKYPSLSLTLEGHNGWVNSAAYNSDASLAATNSDDNTSKIWDANTGQLLQTLTGHTADVFWSAFSPDNKHIITGSEDRSAKIWDVATGQIILTLKGHTGWVVHVAFSPDNKHVATASLDGTVRIWDATTGNLVRTLLGHTNAVYSVSFNKNGSRLLTSSKDYTIKLWDTNGITLKTFIGHNGGVHSAEFNPDETKIVSGGREDKDVRIWDIATGNVIKIFPGYRHWVWHASFSPDGKYIASGDQAGYVTLWEISSGNNIAEWDHHGAVGATWFSPDGNKLLTGANDRTGRIWDVSTIDNSYDLSDSSWTIESPPLSQFRIVQPNGGETLIVGAEAFITWEGVLPETPVRIEYSTDAGITWRTINNAATGLQYLWKVPNTPSTQCLGRVSIANLSTVSTNLQLKAHSDRVNSVAYNIDGTTVATNSDDNTIKLWDAPSGQLLTTLIGHQGDIFWSAFSPDGTKIVSGSGDQTAKIWDVSSGTTLATLVGHAGAVTHVAFSPNGTMVATASDDGTVKLWDVETGTLTRTIIGHTTGVHSVVFSKNGQQLLTASRDYTIKLWDIDGTIIRTFIGHNGVVNSAEFSPDETKIVSGGRDSSVRIWNADNGQELYTINGLDGWVWHASFSNDGQLIATADQSGYVNVYNAATSALELTWYAHDGEVGAVWFNPDDSRILSGANDMLGKIWNFTAGSLQQISDVSDSIWGIYRTTSEAERAHFAQIHAQIHSYPNPFTNSARIDYVVPETGHVRLQIIDIAGAEIATLIDQDVEQGTYSVMFTPNAPLAAGIYVCVLTTNAGTIHTKLIAQ